MSENKGYHAHVYYNTATKAKAAKLSATLIGKFKVEGGTLSDEPRGPHPISQFNVIFETPEFQQIVPWLMLNHGRLSIMVHPNTTNPRRDHLADALWIGSPLAVHGDKLPEEAAMEQAPAPNTRPVLHP